MTETTDDLVKRWVQAQQRVERSRNELNSAECELSNATNALGKHLVPKSGKQGEQFGIWVSGECIGIPGDRIIQIVLKGISDYELAWRK